MAAAASDEGDGAAGGFAGPQRARSNFKAFSSFSPSCRQRIPQNPEPAVTYITIRAQRQPLQLHMGAMTRHSWQMGPWSVNGCFVASSVARRVRAMASSCHQARAHMRGPQAMFGSSLLNERVGALFAFDQLLAWWSAPSGDTIAFLTVLTSFSAAVPKTAKHPSALASQGQPGGATRDACRARGASQSKG